MGLSLSPVKSIQSTMMLGIVLQCHSVQVTPYGLVDQNVVCIKNKASIDGETDISKLM